MFIPSPSYADEELKTKVDSETVCCRLLIIGLIVSLSLWIVTVAYLYISYFLFDTLSTPN